MKILLDNETFFAVCTYEERLIFKNSGWRFNQLKKRWETQSLSIADLFLDIAEGTAKERLLSVHEIVNKAISSSVATDSDIELWSPEGKQYLGFQKAGVEGIIARRSTLLADQPGLGKGQRETDRVLTVDGWVTIRDLKVGDNVFSSNGKPYRVSGKYPRGVLDTFEVLFSDGDSLTVDGDHLWEVKNRTYKNRDGEIVESPWRTKETRELLRDFESGKFSWSKPRIPLAEISYPSQNLEISPYLIGALIGDGGIKHSVMFSSSDSEIIERVSRELPKGCQLVHSSVYDYRIVGSGEIGGNPVRNYLKVSGLFGKGSDDKFIPDKYLVGSVSQRKELLSGLMDTDGYVSKDGCTVQYSSNSAVLAYQVKELVNSLGGVAWISSKISSSGKEHFTVSVKVSFNPFFVLRKRDRFHPSNPHRIIKSIVPNGRHEITCISVESPDRTYVTENHIVTHNTIQAIGVINNTNIKDVIIIVPASLQFNWIRELKYWLKPGVTVGYTKTRRVKESKDSTKTIAQYVWPATDIVVTTYDMLERYEKESRQQVWDLMVCDEAHLIANKKTLRAKYVWGFGRGKKTVSAIPERKALFITGTPILNKPIDLWAFCEKCDPDDLGRSWQYYTTRYCGAFDDFFGHRDVSGATNLEELQFKLRSKFMIRRMKADVLKDLPPKLRKIVEFPAEGAKKVVKKELKAFSANLSKLTAMNEDRPFEEEELNVDVDLDVLSGWVMEAADKAHSYDKFASGEMTLEDYMKLHFEAMASAREDVGLAKVDMVAEYVKELLKTEEKVVIMCVHSGVVNALKKHFPGCAILTGSVASLKARQNAVDRFQNDPECRVFIGNIDAAGVGITLTAASNLVFAELGWVPAMMEQAEDRIHRIGQANEAVIHYLVLRGSMEALVVEKLIQKQEMIAKALNVNEKV